MWAENLDKEPDTVAALVEYAATLLEKAGVFFGHGTDNPYDEAAFIVLESMKLPPDGLNRHAGKRVPVKLRQEILDTVDARIRTRKPAAYLLNRAYMHGIPFYVDERVIVPRSFIGELMCGGDEPVFARETGKIKTVLDLCTGSGCLAILAAMTFPGAKTDAVDLSPDALEVARRNVNEHGLRKRITLHQGDLFAPIADKTYDLIITNPPYVDAAAMASLPPEYQREPAMALASGTDGMDIVRRILKDSHSHLKSNGVLVCEIGQGKEIIEKEFPNLPFLWLDTECSSGEVFCLRQKDF